MLSFISSFLVLSFLAFFATATPITTDNQGTASLYTSQGIFYYAGDTDACGIKFTGADLVAAVSPTVYDDKAVCGKMLSITYGSVTQAVMVVDLCLSCGDSDLALSKSAFEKFADPSVGELVGITWSRD